MFDKHYIKNNNTQKTLKSITKKRSVIKRLNQCNILIRTINHNIYFTTLKFV